ncbi:MAG: methyl-accepting chemotaxis protein [Nitrospirae bacterium]|nr:methyl-accepting chemotaxis protein [Nitrospirota bacterium]
MLKGIFKNVSVRLLLNGALITLSLLCVLLTSLLGWGAYQRRVVAVRLSSMNDMADKIIVAAAQEALERGVTATALGINESASDDVLTRIKDFRIKGDGALNEALTIARKIASEEPASRFATIHDQTNQAYKSLVEFRKRVDRSLQGVEREIEPYEWFKAMTGLIENAARLRQAAFASAEPLQQITQDNLILKQAVWLISENMGRERGTIGPIIATQKPVPPAVMENLKTFHAVAEVATADILSLKGAKGVDSRIVSAIDDMEKALARFDEIRGDVYLAAGTGNYTISPQEWIARSTGAIDKVLAVSSAVTEVSGDKAREVTGQSLRRMILALIQIVGTVLFVFFVLILVYEKTCRIDHLRGSMEQLARGEGDLTFRLDAGSGDEIGMAAGAFNTFMDQLQGIIHQVRKATDQVASAAVELSAMSEQMSKGSTDQTQQTIQAATAIEEMSASVTEVAKNASDVASFSKNARDMADRGGGVVSGAVKGMEKIAQSVRETATVIEALGARSKQIGEIVSVIDNIAEQTNLLALNAAIEAARASDQGKGFAVVADEVRKLAERTTKATSEIAAMIKTIQLDIQKAVTTMNEGTGEVESGRVLTNEAGQALSQIVDGSQKVMDMVMQIAVASEEQSSVSSEISGNVEKISQLCKENNSAASQTANASGDLSMLATELQQMVSRFKV